MRIIKALLGLQVLLNGKVWKTSTLNKISWRKIEKGIIKVIYVKFQNQIADILAKFMIWFKYFFQGLSRDQFFKHFEKWFFWPCSFNFNIFQISSISVFSCCGVMLFIVIESQCDTFGIIIILHKLKKFNPFSRIIGQF